MTNEKQRCRPNNLKYSKIIGTKRVNVMYSKYILNLTINEIASENNINYNSVMNILKHQKRQRIQEERM